ncbi:MULTISPECIES: carbohydrate ABC transporter permease [Paenibacillus]|uniref:ABC transporter permease subunit n=1 Tax=Paenibacillus macerans TaxID=44252 RepID=A0A090ZKW7_PAEMA|nr:carbohydrate ABC transporter permease [Paenibacillus macerans]KFN11038.1 binding--dependent transport system inner membrane component family protein [Paenibacillus macerans]MCY7560843.1 carbohydrate ABC transporter permease [Paenibacillus macerans]MEC0152237.1 carbohydrate ABC transporter permease [Paenibacillus macerans]MUG24613.1 ABC transporter permease subunit [Paenibacillus macerans]SUA83498.1 binding-protein-dependent transport system inner membrane protein [Paenibacillus macerans]
MKIRKIAVRLSLYAVLSAGGLVFVFPFYWMLRTAFVGMDGLFAIPPDIVPDSLRFDNFAKALSSNPFGRYFWNSTVVTALSIAGVVLSSSVCAYSFSRITWPGRDKIFGFILTGLMMPFFVVMIPHFLGWKTLHLTDTLVPLIAPAWFGGGVFNIFLLRQFFLTIPREMDEAAKMDGAGHFRIYWNVIMPLGKQSLIVVGMLTFLANWNDYLAPMVFISSEKNYTLMLGLTLFQGTYSAQWHLMMAATAIIVLPSLAVFLVGQRYFVEGIAMSGVKG